MHDRVHAAQRLVTFAAVGIAATLTYLAITLSLQALGLPPSVANLIGVAGSLLLSYLGHHRLTFGKVGQHGRYGVRFAIVSAALAGASVLWTSWATRHAGLSPPATAIVVAIAYPPLSYALNALWAFRDRRRSAQGAPALRR